MNEVTKEEPLNFVDETKTTVIPVITEEVKEVLEPNKLKKNNLHLFVLAIIVIVAACLGVFYYYSSSPYQLTKLAIKNLSKDSINIIESIESNIVDFDLSQEALTTTGSLDIFINEDFASTLGLSGLSEYLTHTYHYEVGLDPRNETINVNFKIADNEINLLNTDFSLINNDLFFDSEFAHTRPLQITDDELEIPLDIFAETKYTTGEYTYLIEKSTEYIIDSLNKDDFSKDKTEIKIDGKSTKVTENLYTLDKESRIEIATDVIELIKKDDKFLTILSNTLSITKEELTKELDEYLGTIHNMEDTDLYLIIYTEGIFNKFVGFELKTENETFITSIIHKEKTEVTIDELFLEISSKDEKTTYKFYTDPKEPFTLVHTNNKNNDIFNLNFTSEGETIEAELTYSNDKKSDQLSNAEYRFSIKMIIEEELTELIVINGTNSLTVSDTIIPISKVDSVSINSLLNIELETALTNFSNAAEKTLPGLFITPIISLINPIEEISNETKCLTATDCVSFGDSNYCIYTNSYGEEEEIICDI